MRNTLSIVYWSRTRVNTRRAVPARQDDDVDTTMPDDTPRAKDRAPTRCLMPPLYSSAPVPHVTMSMQHATSAEAAPINIRDKRRADAAAQYVARCYYRLFMPRRDAP